MDKPSPIPFYDITIDANDFDNDVMKLFGQLRPDWKKEDIVSKKYSEGFINQMQRFHVTSDPEKDDAIVVRIHGSALGDFRDKQQEFLTMQVAHVAGCFPPVLAIFHNGVAYKFAKGRTLKPDDLNNPKVIRAITKKLRKFHVTDPDTVNLVDCEGNTGVKYDRSTKWESMQAGLLAHYPEKLQDPEKDEIFQKYKLPKDEIEVNVKKTRTFADTYADMVLCHGDLHIRNIVYNEDADDITLIDYEMSEFRDEVSDLEYMFNNRNMLELLGIIKPEDPEISEESRDLWLRSYLETKWSLMGRNPDNIPEVAMEKLEMELKIYGIHVAIALFCAAYAENDQFPLPVIKLLPMASTEWNAHKHELPGLMEEHDKIYRKYQELGL